MSLGTSLLRGSHLGSNHHTGDDEGICVGDRHQAVGRLSSFFLLLVLGFHLSFQSPKK
jgi:hypothetical protein